MQQITFHAGGGKTDDHINRRFFMFLPSYHVT